MKPLKWIIWSGRIPRFAPPASSLSTIAAFLMLIYGSAGHSATNTVTSLADNGAGSLRQIIANSVPGDFIKFGVTGTIALTTGELTVSNDLTFIGPGAEALAISGNHLSRVFTITSDVTVTMSSLSLINGRASDFSQPGGGILNEGILTVSNCILSGNAAADGDWSGGSGGDGGGIYNVGALVLVSSRIIGNASGRGWMQDTISANGGSGGGLFNSGTCLVSGCTFESNFTGCGGDGVYGGWAGSVGGAGGHGGGIYSQTLIELVDCTLRNNYCGGGGKGGDAGVFSMDGGNGGSGGAVYAAGDLIMNGCTIAANHAGAGGDGGYANSGFLGQGGSGGSGGGISSSFPGWTGNLFLTNCTLTANCAGDGGYDPLARSIGGSGGGIYACWSNHILVSCTIVSNYIGFGGVYGRDGMGGGICFDVVTAPIFVNDMVAQNVGPRFWLLGAGPDILGSVTSFGHNLIGATNGAAGFTMPGDLAGSLDQPLDPKVGPLADNGGPTWTMALLPGSPAIDAGTPLGAPAADQRGIARPQGPGVDIGAFEYQYIPVFNCPVIHGATNCLLQMSGLLPNQTFSLETSSNLINWAGITNFVAGTNGMFQFSDPISASVQSRFYRLKSASP
jgi:hypothetical protein